MLSLTIACGPYFGPEAILASVFIFLVLKPLAYFAFIQAFRYRVCRAVPMRYSQAAKLAVYRALLGLGVIAPIALVLSAEAYHLSWVILYAERVASWWIVGFAGASLRGRRLLGWILSGTLLNAAIDLALYLPLTGAGRTLSQYGLPDDPWMASCLIVLVIIAFIAALHVIGRRESLKRRYMTGRYCAGCGYDLSGNLSGRCPECGKVIGAAIPHDV